MRLPYRPELDQPFGVVHGGAIASPIDTVVVPAVGAAYEAGWGYATLTMDIQYLGAVVREDAVAEGWVTQRPLHRLLPGRGPHRRRAAGRQRRSRTRCRRRLSPPRLHGRARVPAGGRHRQGERRWGSAPVRHARPRPTEGTSMIRRAAALSLAAALALGGAAACGDDEDGDGGVTDEEIQEGEDTVDSLGDEAEEELDAQDEGSNDDGE